MLNKHFRISALQCNFQTPDETLAMPERWEEIGFNAEQLFHTHADLYSAIYDPKRHRELLTKYLENSRKHGIRTIVYMNVHILGPSLTEHFDEWCTRDANGVPQKLYGSYPGSCLNSGWRQYFYECLESLKEFDIEGFFFDGPTFTECHCPHCQAKFLERYGKPMSEATAQEVKAFTNVMVTEFKKELSLKVKSINPSWISYYNEGLLAGRLTAEAMKATLKNDDIIGTEGGFFFYDEPRKVPYWKCSSAAKMAEAVADGKPTVIFFAGDHKAWGWFMHTDSELKLCYASALGNGASIWMGFHHRPDTLETPSGVPIREMVQFDKKHDALYQNTRNAAEIALFYSFNTAHYYNSTSGASDFYGSATLNAQMPGDYYQCVNGAFGVLEHLSLPYAVVTDLAPEKMMQYKTLLVPNCAMLDDKSLQAMKEFVAQGGLLIADGEFGFYNADGSVRSDTASLVELTGAIPARNWTDMRAHNYMSVTDSAFHNDNPFGYIPAPRWVYKLELTNGAEAAVKIPEPMIGCYAARPGKPEFPVAASRRLGKGECLFFCGGLFEYYVRFQIHAIRNWFQFLLDKRPSQFKLLNSKPGISMTVRTTQDGKTLVHLTNFIGVTRPLDGVVPLNGLKLAAPASLTSAVNLVTGEALAKDAEGNFILPEQKEYAVFLL